MPYYHKGDPRVRKKDFGKTLFPSYIRTCGVRLTEAVTGIFAILLSARMLNFSFLRDFDGDRGYATLQRRAGAI